MPRNNNRGGRGGRNNNPSGRNQHSDWGVMEMARERPIAAAAAAAGAAGWPVPVVEENRDQRPAEQPQRPVQRMARRHAFERRVRRHRGPHGHRVDRIDQPRHERDRRRQRQPRPSKRRRRNVDHRERSRTRQEPADDLSHHCERSEAIQFRRAGLLRRIRSSQ